MSQNMDGTVAPVSKRSEFLLRRSYIWYPVFFAVFMSPINSNVSKVITHPGGWRLALYLGGIFMGLGYFVGGMLIACAKPFPVEGSACGRLRRFFTGTASEAEVLQCFSSVMLVPIGGIMGLFHMWMLVKRMSGCTLGNARNISGCMFVQAVWLVFWSVWYVRARAYRASDPEYDVKIASEDGTRACASPLSGATAAAGTNRALGVALNCTLASSVIIVLSMVLRAVFFLVSSGSVDTFNRFYTGGNSQNCPSA